MPGRIPLARKNLTHNLARTVVSLGGVALAVVLMFMQLGFLGAVGDTATIIYRHMPADIVIRSPDYLHLFEPNSIDESVARAVRGVGEVGDIRPFDASLATWRNPATHETRTIAVIGIDPLKPAVVTPELVEKAERLTSDEFVIVDRASGPEFVPTVTEPGEVADPWRSFQGPDEDRITSTANSAIDTFGPEHIWTRAECNGRSVRVVETFELGTGLAAAGALAMNRDAFRRISFGRHEQRVSMLLINLREGAETAAAKAAIQERLQTLGYGSLVVLSHDEAMRWEINRWYFGTPIGLIFFMGVGVAVVVGGVICYMVLAGEVMANLAEYATLKAIGYTDGYLCRVLLWQAVMIAGMAFVPALVLSLGLYEVTSQLAAIPIDMTWLRIVAVAIISVLMCTSAGLVALRKLTKAEPASLF